MLQNLSATCSDYCWTAKASLKCRNLSYLVLFFKPIFIAKYVERCVSDLL